MHATQVHTESTVETVFRSRKGPTPPRHRCPEIPLIIVQHLDPELPSVAGHFSNQTSKGQLLQVPL